MQGVRRVYSYLVLTLRVMFFVNQTYRSACCLLVYFFTPCLTLYMFTYCSIIAALLLHLVLRGGRNRCY